MRDRVRLLASNAAPVHEHCAEHERTRELELVRIDRERAHQRELERERQRELERERQRELERDVQRQREHCERGLLINASTVVHFDLK
jgi:hypothetical protein